MKKLFAPSLALCVLLIFSAEGLSEQPQYKAAFNLAYDPLNYKYVEYKSPIRFQHNIQLTMIDTRPDKEKVFNKEIQYFYDDIWTEPPAEMLGKIFLKELRSTTMFRSVDLEKRAPSLILEIRLSSLIGHYGQDQIAKGFIKIRSTLKRASDDHIILNKEYEETYKSEVRRFAIIYKVMLRHIGNAVHNVVQKTLVDLENSLVKEIK